MLFRLKPAGLGAARRTEYPREVFLMTLPDTTELTACKGVSHHE